MRVSRKYVVGCAVGAASLLIGGAAVAAGGSDNWTSAGHDLSNTRYQNNETAIGTGNAGALDVKWAFTTGGDVSATPAVDDSKVYVPDWAGNLYAVDRATGALVWSRQLSDYTGVTGDLARVTPAVAGNRLILGNQRNFLNLFPDPGAYVFAVNKNTGALLWKTKVEDHFAAFVTQSAVVDGNVAYVGVSSREEALAASGAYECCSFRGSFLALDVNTGAILWKTYMVPPGWTGGAVWGSTAAVDKSRKTVYVTTGNNYTAPQEALDCVENATTPEDIRACSPPDNYFDSVLALDTATGAVKWVTTALPFDAWNVGCIPFFGDGVNCPEPEGPDYDFGQGPSLFTVKTASGKRDLVGAGQKSGHYWALDADSGAVEWVTETGPGGTAGGLQWGSAVDGNRIYTANANSNNKEWELLQNGLPTGVTTTQGIWSGLDAATGEILWQTLPPNGGGASGPATTANGVVYACALDPVGHMVAMDAATGDILWDFASGGSCLSGGAISRGTVYWGSGYSNFGFGTPNNKLYAFSLNGS